MSAKRTALVAVCPICHTGISAWRTWRASRYTALTCPTCGSRLGRGLNWKSVAAGLLAVGLIIGWGEAAKALGFGLPVTIAGFAVSFLLAWILDMTTVRLVNFEEPRAVRPAIRIVLIVWLVLGCAAPVFFLPSIRWMIHAWFLGQPVVVNATTAVFFAAMIFTVSGPLAVIVVPFRLGFRPLLVGLCFAAWLTSNAAFVVTLYSE